MMGCHFLGDTFIFYIYSSKKSKNSNIFSFLTLTNSHLPHWDYSGLKMARDDVKYCTNNTFCENIYVYARSIKTSRPHLMPVSIDCFTLTTLHFVTKIEATLGNLSPHSSQRNWFVHTSLASVSFGNQSGGIITFHLDNLWLHNEIRSITSFVLLWIRVRYSWNVRLPYQSFQKRTIHFQIISVLPW